MDESRTTESDRTAPPERPWLEVLGSRHFSAWLAVHNVSLELATSHKASSLFAERLGLM
jgi:hypothetical protein